jgi:amino acid adenylation domain-containing protein
VNNLSKAIAGLDPRKRELLAQLLKESHLDVSRAVILPAPRTGGAYPLSFAQERLWFLDRLWPGDAAYNLPSAMRLAGDLDLGALARTLVAIVRRHETLRTRFVEREGRPFQVVAAPWAVALPLVDLAALPATAREREAERLADAEALRAFDLGRGRLLRVTLLRLAAGLYVLLFNMHHIVADGWSLALLIREVGALYPALRAGAPSPLPDLGLQYVDYALWQREWLQGEVLERQLGYWQRQLAGAPPQLELPTDRPRPPAPSFRGGQFGCALPEEIRAGVAALGRRSGATLFMVLLAAFATLLRQLSGSEDLCVGTPVAGRHHPELEKLIGFFVNNLVLRCDLAGDPSFVALLGRVQEVALAAFDHQDLPFEKLVEELQPARSLGRQPLFQVLFGLQNTPQESIQGTFGVETSAQPFRNPTAKFDLSLYCREFPGGLVAAFDYATDLFDAATIAALGARFLALLAAVAADPSRRLSELPLLPPAERHQLRFEWNDGAAADGEPAGSLHGLAEAQADRTPGAVAVADGALALTYRELEERANRLARHLRRLGVGPESTVGVCTGRSAALVVALLGTLKAGGAYVALDPAYPAERLAFLSADARLSLVLTEERSQEALPAGGPRRLLLDRDRAAVAAESAARPVGGAGPDGLAYVLYTSGSTGRPKGVAVRHAAAAARLRWAASAFPRDALAGVLAATSINFDLSVFELFAPLAAGGAAVLAADALHLPRCPAVPITLVNTVPSAAAELLRGGTLPATATTVNLAGEPPGEDLVRALFATPTVARVYNLYGPSEDTTYSTWARLAPGIAGPPAIGRPLPGTWAHVVDDRLVLVPAGAAGELCLGGVGLARGYHGRPALTAGRFVPDPFSGRAGARLYRTCDRVRRRRDGALLFLGRLDDQVKIRGFRVEPGEVAAALALHPRVRQAAVVARRFPAGDLRLVAYVVEAAGGGEVVPALAAHLRQRLPAHLVPADLVLLAALPLLPNGKVDRGALARLEPVPGGAVSRPAHVPPRTPVEEVLAGIWAEVLGVERVGADDNFFELSGHSLLATQVAYRVRQAFGVELPLRRLFERATLAELAREVEAAGPGAGRAAAVLAAAIEPFSREPRQRCGRPLPASFVQEWGWRLVGGSGDAALNMPLALRLRGRLDLAALGRAWAEIVRRHEAIRTRFLVSGTPGTAGTAGAEVLQEIAPPGAAPLPVVDLSGLPGAPRLDLARRLAGEEAAQPFDLGAGPLARARAAVLAPADHLFLFTIHHIVADGWSVALLQSELVALYDAFAHGEPSPLPEPTLQYADFAVWQRRTFRGELLAEQIAWWRDRLAGRPPILELPADFPRPATFGPATVGDTLLLTGEVLERLRALCRACGCSLPMALVAAIDVLLHRYTGYEDVILGSTFAGRDRRELSGIVGLFLNSVALRTDLSGGPSFRELLLRVRETVLAAYGRQDLPFPRLCEELFPDREVNRTLLFRVMFNMLSFPVPPGGGGRAPGFEIEAFSVEEEHAKYDLTFDCRDGADFVHCRLAGAADLFRQASICNIKKDYESLLAQVVADPETRLDRLLPAPRHGAVPLVAEPVAGR